MFLKQNAKNLKTSWKSNWFVKSSFNFKKHIYEDIFIRKYISSFFFKWSKFYTYKVLGSIYLFRTFGKLYINLYFFYPLTRLRKSKALKRRRKVKQEISFNNLEVKPIYKYKKHLSIIFFFYQLEKILGVQVFFKFRNICNGIVNSNISTIIITKITNLLTNKLSHFKYQFNEEVYVNTIIFLVNLLKFKKPDGLLLANYISLLLLNFQKHNQLLMFLKRLLQTLQKIFKFNGVKILLSGKLNGFSRAQSKQVQVGCVSLQSYNLPYIEGYSHAYTNAGKIGVKIWIC